MRICSKQIKEIATMGKLSKSTYANTGNFIPYFTITGNLVTKEPMECHKKFFMYLRIPT
jgi:hypothetical protein